MHIQLFGGLEIRCRAGEPVRLPTRKAALLLAILALAGGKGARREALSEALWSDRGEAQARGSLRQALAAVRRALSDAGGGVIRIEGDLEEVRLVADQEHVDVWLFDKLLQAKDPVARAAAAGLYHGDLLAGIASPDSLEQWLAPHRRAYRAKALALVEDLSLAGAEPDCRALADRLLSTDPAAEEAHRALIRLCLKQGRINAALRQFELCKAALKRELGVEPETQTSALVSALRAPRDAVGDLTPLPPGPEAPAAATPPARDREQPSVVVLPFDNLSSEADEYFVDGVVEEITAALSRVREFFVIARQSAFTYKGRFADVREVGRELGVNYVVEGTVRRGGDRLRISVQLVDAETRRQLWSERYEGATTDIFEFQDQIAGQVAGAIYPAVRNAEIEAAKRKPPASLGAYDLVMRAYPKLWGHNAEANDEAIAILDRAVAIDPAYGRAHALLAWCHALKATYVWSPVPDEELALARRAVETAAGTIDDDPTALTAAGAATSLCGDQERAAAFMERALTLDPNNAWAWTRFGWVAIYRGEPQRATERFERALRLSPMDPFAFNMRSGVATALASAGRLEEATAIIRDVINKHPDVTWVYRQLAAWSGMNGDLETARWAAGKLMSAHPNFTLERFVAVPVFRNIPDYGEKMAAALRQAGVPER
jgi:TolB-like protein/DNA-binding SARP family transcriptional activator